MVRVPSNLVKYNDLLGRLVIDRSTTEEVGRVEQIWIDPSLHRTIGLTVRSGLLGRQRYSVAWQQVVSVGRDSILVRSPQPLTGEGVPFPDTICCPGAGLEVWSDSGDRAGKIVDYRFDSETGAIFDYLFVAKGLRSLTDGAYRLLPDSILQTGEKRAIVAQAAVDSAEKIVKGLGDRIDSARDYLQEDYEKTLDRWSNVGQTARGIAGKVRETVQQAAEKLPDAKEQLQERTQKLQEKTQKLTDLAKEKFSSSTSKTQETESKPQGTEPKTIDIDSDADRGPAEPESKGDPSESSEE